MFYALFILGSISISTVNGWGPIGHALVAEIAQSLLTNDSANFVRDYLPWYTTGNLSTLSSWPDTIIYPESNPVDYINWQWSKELHYVNTPDWVCNYDRNRDCNWTNAQNCVDGAIRNYTGRLADKKQDVIQRHEALKFLVHFVGDAHQPLHAGFTSDRGGNTIEGTFFEKSTDLHKIWDTLMITRRISLDFHNNTNEYYNYLLSTLQTTYAANVSQWLICSPGDESEYLACSTTWIIENMDLNCDQVYRDEDGKPMNSSERFHLGQTYYNTRLVFLEQRLLQSGVRLGTIINKIVASKKSHHHKDDDDVFCSRTIFLFMILLLEVVLLVFLIAYCLVRRRRQALMNNLQPTLLSMLIKHKLYRKTK